MKIPMNLLILTLIATSITVSGTPSPTTRSTGDQVVEIASGAGNTRVSVSPAEEQLSKATAAVVGVSEDISGKAKEILSDAKGRFRATPRELRCDSVGNCKHKIAGVLRKAKEKAIKAEEKVKELASGVLTSEVQECTEGVRQNAQEKKGVGWKKKLSHFLIKRGKWLIWGTFRDIFLPKSVRSLTGVIQIMGFSMAYGISMWVTFEMNHILARMFPEQQLRMVQTKIYPVYLKAMVGSIGLALLGHLTRQKANDLLKNKREMLQGFNLMVSMLSVLANLLFLEPRATKVKFERLKMEKEEGRGIDDLSASTTERDVTDAPMALVSDPPTATTTVQPEPGSVKDETESKLSKLDHKLRQLNLVSTLLSLVTLMGLTCHLMYLGDRLALST